MSKPVWSWCNLFRCQWGVTIFTSDNFFKTDISKKAHEHIWIHSSQLCTHTNAASPTRPVLKETASWQDVESKERKLLKESARKQMPFSTATTFIGIITESIRDLSKFQRLLGNAFSFLHALTSFAQLIPNKLWPHPN